MPVDQTQPSKLSEILAHHHRSLRPRLSYLAQTRRGPAFSISQPGTSRLQPRRWRNQLTIPGSTIRGVRVRYSRYPRSSRQPNFFHHSLPIHLVSTTRTRFSPLYWPRRTSRAILCASQAHIEPPPSSPFRSSDLFRLPPRRHPRSPAVPLLAPLSTTNGRRVLSRCYTDAPPTSLPSIQIAGYPKSHLPAPQNCSQRSLQQLPSSPHPPRSKGWPLSGAVHRAS
ncbi:hypothetical protein FA13DRAFT_245752 [Coprinellus micaceus]|uniref:Uncharacterized protein n=1 Tax=Coprinellus micaceus TaxID=71717 RepID=A0A4Y7SEK8_COPMI|nr:hypothetical protein FA13DRAFT_245752 [Coprinellus micaceus]